MNRYLFSLMILGAIISLVLCSGEIKKSLYDTENISNELLTKYNELNGIVDDPKLIYGILIF